MKFSKRQKIEKNHQLKTASLKFNKIDRPLEKLIKRKKKNERKNINIDYTDIQKIRGYKNNFTSNIFGKLCLKATNYHLSSFKPESKKDTFLGSLQKFPHS